MTTGIALSAEAAALADQTLHLSDRRWRVFVCADCHSDDPDNEYDTPFVMVMEESGEVEDCPRCGGHLGMEEDVLVVLTPVEGRRW